MNTLYFLIHYKHNIWHYKYTWIHNIHVFLSDWPMINILKYNIKYTQHTHIYLHTRTHAQHRVKKLCVRVIKGGGALSKIEYMQMYLHMFCMHKTAHKNGQKKVLFFCLLRRDVTTIWVFKQCTLNKRQFRLRDEGKKANAPGTFS